MRVAVRRVHHEAPRHPLLDHELGVKHRRRHVEARRRHGNERAPEVGDVMAA